MQKINISQRLDSLDKHWSPKVLAEANGQLIKVAKGKGELVWHTHENEDEVFLVLSGRLTICLKEANELKAGNEITEVHLEQGDMLVVPKGVEHCPFAEEETHFLLFEPKATMHTGTLKTEQTVDIAEQYS